MLEHTTMASVTSHFGWNSREAFLSESERRMINILTEI